MVSGYMLFVVLLVLPLCILCKPAVMAKKTHLTVYKGQDVNFLVITDIPIIYAHFGEAKEGSYHYPNPLVFRVDKSNNVTLATNTSYSPRMEFKGNLTDGQVLFKLSNTQLSDSGEYLIYMRESDKAPDAVTFVLTVKDHPIHEPNDTGPLTSTATHTTGSNNWDDNAGSDSSTPVPTTSPVKTANTTSSPTQAYNRPTPTGNKIEIIAPSVTLGIAFILCIIWKIKSWWHKRFGQSNIELQSEPEVGQRNSTSEAEIIELQNKFEQKNTTCESNAPVDTYGKLDPTMERLIYEAEEPGGAEL